MVAQRCGLNQSAFTIILPNEAFLTVYSWATSPGSLGNMLNIGLSAARPARNGGHLEVLSMKSPVPSGSV
jgi:hypothetical protein